MSPTIEPGQNFRLWFGPADTEILALADDGTPITGGADDGVGPMTEITDAVTEVKSTELVRRLLHLEKQKADCRRRSVACVLTLNGVVVGKGYNSLPDGSCLQGECPRGLLSYEEAPRNVGYENPAHPCHAIHAEDAAIAEAGAWAQGAIAWITEPPCPRCQQRLKDAGVVDFVHVILK